MTTNDTTVNLTISGEELGVIVAALNDYAWSARTFEPAKAQLADQLASCWAPHVPPKG